MILKVSSSRNDSVIVGLAGRASLALWRLTSMKAESLLCRQYQELGWAGGLCLSCAARRAAVCGAALFRCSSVSRADTRQEVPDPGTSLLWVSLCLSVLSGVSVLSHPHLSLQKGHNLHVLTHQEWKVRLLLQTVMVIACLRGESICAANGHLHNPISLYCVISTVGLPRGVGREELGNINRKMTSSKRALFSTYCRLASWFRADKQIWPESHCSIFWWHQHS